MYGSNKIQNPNEAFYDFMLSDSQPEIFVNDGTFSSSIKKREITNITDDITIYITIQGQSAFNNFTLNTTTGDTTTEDSEPTTVPTTNTTTDTSTSMSFHSIAHNEKELPKLIYLYRINLSPDYCRFTVT